MTTKAKKPAVKPAAVAFDKHAALVTLGVEFGTYDSGVHLAAKALDTISALCKELKANGVKIGDSRTCENAQKLFNAMPQSIQVNTRRNYLSSARKAINEGKPFSTNASRDKAKAESKAKGGKGGKAKTGTGNILISIGKGAKPADAAEKLLKGFNAMKSANDELAGLAAFLIDAIADAKAAKFKA